MPFYHGQATPLLISDQTWLIDTTTSQRKYFCFCGGDWGRGCRFAAAMASLQLFKSLILNNENSFPFHKNNIKLSSNYTHLAQPHKKPVSITGRPLIIKTVTLLRPNHTPAAVIIEFTKPKSYEFYNKGFPNFEMKVKPSLFQVDPNKVDLTKEKRC